MQETESIDEYILQHIDPENDYLKALYRDTHVKLLRPRMASGHLQGRMLKMGIPPFAWLKGFRRAECYIRLR